MMQGDSWHSTSANDALRDDEVHVWRASLDIPLGCASALQKTLSEDERDWAGRYYFEKDRLHFTVARGLLRTILGRYLKRKPDQLHFCFSSGGKPFLDGNSEGGGLQFNLSHSHGLALYAFSRGRQVGIDLERIRSDVNIDDIAERLFSSREAAAIKAARGSARDELFFTIWTRKEAYLKARGRGFLLPLDGFDVSQCGGTPASSPVIERNPAEASCWFVQDLPPIAGYKAALTVEGNEWRLRCSQWLW